MGAEKECRDWFIDNGFMICRVSAPVRPRLPVWPVIPFGPGAGYTGETGSTNATNIM
jgi:hypothetical protein